MTLNQEVWESIPAEIIRYSSDFKNNILVANRGRLSGVIPGMGMLDNGKIAGLVTEVTEHESLSSAHHSFTYSMECKTRK